MTVNLSALAGAGQQFFDNNGVILSGGKLYSYAAGTSTPQATYTSASGSTAHTNPIVLDSAGRVATGEIWVTALQAYKFVLYTSTNVLIATWDNITGISGTGIATDAALVSYTPIGTGAVVTNVQSKLRETVSVFDFMTAAQIADVIANTQILDVTTAIQAAINTQKQIFFPAGSYKTTSPIIVSGSYFNIYGVQGKSIISGTGYISSTTSDDLSYPTATNPGPMSGSCFYFTSLTYYSNIESISFSGYKFACAYLTPHNSPRFTNCSYSYCNAFVFCYQGSQNYTYDTVYGEGNCGPVHISSATCFPSGTPYAGEDNYYTDGFTFANLNGSLSTTGIVNTYFDAWFQNSILRPTVGSYSIATSNYIYPFATTLVETKPSGWSLAFVPMRNPRGMFGIEISDIDIRVNYGYGTALFNTVVFSAYINNYVWEVYNSTAAQHFIIGAVSRLNVSNITTNVSGTPQIPFIKYTNNNGDAVGGTPYNTSTTFISCVITPCTYLGVNLPTYGHDGAVTSTKQTVLNAGLVGDEVYDPRADGSVVTAFSPLGFGSHYTNSQFLKAWNFSAALPVKTSDNYYRRSLRFDSQNYDATGLIQISVLNQTTNETDYGEFYIQTGATYNLTTSAAVNNGDAYIPVTTAPTRAFTPFSVFTFNGVQVIANYYDATTGRIYLEGLVSGMAGTAASGSTLTKTAYFSTTITPFSRGFIQFGFGIAAFASADALNLVSLVSAYSNALTVTDQAVFVSLTITNVSMPAISTGTAIPTTGLWARGARIWSSTPTAGATPGWVCVTAGTPGTWKAMASLAA
jgi:hypothetical protein